MAKEAELLWRFMRKRVKIFCGDKSTLSGHFFCIVTQTFRFCFVLFVCAKQKDFYILVRVSVDHARTFNTFVILFI